MTPRHRPGAIFEFPAAIGKAIDATNAIKSVNSMIRKFTRNHKQCANVDSALKLGYLAIHEASKKWTTPIVGWKAARNHCAIMFAGRMPTLSGCVPGSWRCAAW